MTTDVDVKVVRQYLDVLKKHRSEHGPKTIVLMEMGSWYEMYTLDENDPTILDLSRVTGLKLSTRSGDIPSKPSEVVSRHGYHFNLGIPLRDTIYDRYMDLMADEGYTMVMYKQVPADPRLSKKMFTRVYDYTRSPGTTFHEADTCALSNNMTCVWVSLNRSKTHVTFGLSNFNNQTGSLDTYEYDSLYYPNDPTTYDMVERYVSVYRPVETVLVTNHKEAAEFISSTYLTSKKVTLVDLRDDGGYFTAMAHKSESQLYQDECLHHFYPHLNIESLKEGELKERPVATQSLCFLLEFVQQYRDSLVKFVSPPRVNMTSSTLVLANHSLRQLNMIPTTPSETTSRYSSVLDLLNTCRTPMGVREFKHVLLNPVNDPTTLRKAYDEVELVLKMNDWSAALSQMRDVDVIHRKVAMEKAKPKDYYELHRTSKLFRELCQEHFPRETLRTILGDEVDAVLAKVSSLETMLEQTFDLETAKMVTTFDQSSSASSSLETLFRRGVDPVYDEVLHTKMDERSKLDAILQTLNRMFHALTTAPTAAASKKKKKKAMAKPGATAAADEHEDEEEVTDMFCLKETEKAFNIIITKRRSTIWQGFHDGERSEVVMVPYYSEHDRRQCTVAFDLKGMTFTKYNETSVSLFHPEIAALCHRIFETKEHFMVHLTRVFRGVHAKVHAVMDLTTLVKHIATLDVLNTKREVALKHNYCKPVIVEKGCSKGTGGDDVDDDEEVDGPVSFFEATALRHALIEQIETRETYVSNDVTLNASGVLLFGTNAVGKTSLIKSVGVCLIMAQAGLYVPCTTFRYYPYNQLFTRIIGNDNMFRGMSTFAVEMSELRVILTNCDQRSMVLGDELCSGTETESALGIFAAGIEHLHQQRSSFIFATHFHEIVNVEEVARLDRVSFSHLKVVYDHEHQRLVYDRKLAAGSGDSVYGLEVCKSLRLPDAFLRRAYEFRNKYCDDETYLLQRVKRTRHNSRKLVGKCEICERCMGTEVHHLAYQSQASNHEGGFITNTSGTFHKDHVANLASVCEECHQKIHALGLVYERRRVIGDDTTTTVMKLVSA